MRSKLFRAAVCLLLVCCLIVNVSPIRAEATTAVATATAVSVPGLNVVAAALIGLGVLVGVARTDWNAVANNCAEWLQEQGVIDENGNCKIIQFPDPNGGVPKWFADLALIELIRQWLFDNEIITEAVSVTTTGFSGTLIGSTETYGPYYSLNYLANSYPSELTRLFRDLGIMQNVAVFNICNSSPYYLVGVYWGEDGRLMQGVFENPLGTAHASLYGVYSIEDLTLVNSGRVQLHKSGYSGYSCGVFYDKSYAESQSDFLTGFYLAVDWSYEFAYKSFSSSSELAVRVFQKQSENSVWDSASRYLGKYQASSLYWKSYYIGASNITWGDSSVTTIAVSDGLSQGEIALQEESIETGYAEWYENSVTFALDGEESEILALPAPYSLNINDYYSATQSDIWSGSSFDSDTDTSTEPDTSTNPDSDPVTATGLKGWLDGMLDAIGGWFTDIGESIAAIPQSVADAIADIFIPSQNLDYYAMDLTEFFPFCIPWDIYAFLQLFQADPTAPHLEFDIDFPYMNEPWHLVIDLSDFDSVAQLARNLELVLFIVGLAIFTRERFLRG